MAEPSTQAEYERRFKTSYRITGHGPAVTMHLPCPFCAAAGWLDQPLFDPDRLTSGRGPDVTCTECGRSAAYVYVSTPDSVTVELVQTGGEDPSPWVHCRREPATERPAE